MGSLMRGFSIGVVVALGLAACSHPNRPAGPIGAPIDLLPSLPDSLRMADAGGDSTFHQKMNVGPDSAKVEVTWTTFRHGTGRFIKTLSADLTADAPYDSLTLRSPFEFSNAGTKTAQIESAKASVVWFRGRKSGVVGFEIQGAGRAVVGIPTR